MKVANSKAHLNPVQLFGKPTSKVVGRNGNYLHQTVHSRCPFSQTTTWYIDHREALCMDSEVRREGAHPL